MRWTAQHTDGFTSRLLRYIIRVEDGMAELEASWFLPKPSTSGFRARFAIDDGPVERVVPALRAMDEGYESSRTHLDHKVLEVDVGGERIRRQVYGGAELVATRPELRSFLDFFDWLEGQVVARLPWPPEALTGTPTASKRSEVSFLVLLVVLLVQLPLWLLLGLAWSLSMVVLAGTHPVNALIGGIGWGATMWVVMGGFMAGGLAWRRSATFPVRDHASFRAAVDETCRRLRLVVLAESPDQIILGRKRAPAWLRQEVVLAFDENTATLTASAFSLAAIRKQLHKALAAGATKR